MNDASKTTDYIRVAGKTAVRIKGSGPTYSETYPHQDHLGSPVAETDTSGAITWREDYTPYGEKRLDPAGNRDNEGFTGHIDDDASGLTYMQARYYDPVIGRFLSNDPVAFSPDKPQQFNRYAYTWNDPVNAIDPTGQVALYFTVQLSFQIGGVGGRVSFAAGVDTEKKAAFVSAAGGGSADPATVGAEAGGVQIGAGVGVGAAESSDFVVAEAYTTDIDAGPVSISVASNDPLLDSDGNFGDPLSDSEELGQDTRIRQGEISVGIGFGASSTKTQGGKFERPLPGQQPQEPPSDPCAGSKDQC